MVCPRQDSWNSFENEVPSESVLCVGRSRRSCQLPLRPAQPLTITPGEASGCSPLVCLLHGSERVSLVCHSQRARQSAGEVANWHVGRLSGIMQDLKGTPWQNPGPSCHLVHEPHGK